MNCVLVRPRSDKFMNEILHQWKQWRPRQLVRERDN